MEFPWVEQQQLLLSLVQALNSTLVLSQVLEQVLDALMRITRAERGFLLLADPPADGAGGRAGRRAARPRRAPPRRREHPARRGPGAVELGGAQGAADRGDGGDGQRGRRSLAGRARRASSSWTCARSCASPCARRAWRPGRRGGRTLGAIYVDNPETSAPISPDSLRISEALAHHAALAIENAQLFEREQATIRELRQAQSRLLQSEKLATIGQMAAGIAHELNTPLTYIMGNLELMQAQPLSEPQQAMLRSIGHGADRLKNLAQSLLAFSRPAQEVLVPLSVNDVIERSLELCHYQILRGGVALQKQLADGLPPISGVSNQLEIALINLVVNAVQAMEGGGHAGRRLRGAGRRRRDRRLRHRPRDPRGDPVHDLRAVLYNEAGGKGHRARPLDGADDRRAAQRPHRAHQRRRPGHHLPHPASRRSLTPRSRRRARSNVPALRSNAARATTRRVTARATRRAGSTRVSAVACRSAAGTLRANERAEGNVPAKGILLTGSVVAVAAALVATAGVAGRGPSGLLLASAAVIALAVTAGSKGRN